MYILQEYPDTKVVLRGGSEHQPVATLKDEYGGISHIIEDDHCYVLVNGSKDRGFGTVEYWYPEAVAAMKTLPIPERPTWSPVDAGGENSQESPADLVASVRDIADEFIGRNEWEMRDGGEEP